jgi:hypothetical protein
VCSPSSNTTLDTIQHREIHLFRFIPYSISFSIKQLSFMLMFPSSK